MKYWLSYIKRKITHNAVVEIVKKYIEVIRLDVLYVVTYIFKSIFFYFLKNVLNTTEMARDLGVNKNSSDMVTPQLCRYFCCIQHVFQKTKIMK